MLSLFDGVRGLGFGTVLLKLLVACLCGTLIGLERSSKNRPAGFRTPRWCASPRRWRP